MAQPLAFDHANLSFYRNPDGLKIRIQSTSDWEKRRRQILKNAQLAMGTFPAERGKDFDVTIVGESSLEPDVTVKTLRISVNSKSHVVADLYIPHGVSPTKKRAAILALHPTGAPGKRIIGGPSPRKNRQYANELARRGYVVIAPDYPSFGDLKDHDFAADGLDSGTMQGIINHMRCVDYLQTLDIVDGDRIGVIGHSLGGHNAIFVAVFDHRLKAIVTSCGWTPFHDYYQGKIAGWTSDRYMPLLKTRFQLNPDKVPFDFYELIAALAPRPFYSNSPLLDSNFDVRGVKKAIPRIRQIYELFEAGDQVHVVYPKCEHDFPTEIRDESYRFLDQALSHQPTDSVGFAGELPRIRPLEPAEALKTFNRNDLIQVAAEPLVNDPIAMAFDENRRLFVVEMKGYSEQANEFLGQIRLLEDTDGNGVFEKSTVFADHFSWPTAIICYDGGVFVGAAPDIWFLKDTNGDGKADERRKVFTGFGRSNVQGLMNSFRWGLDNRIHGATSSSGGLVFRPDREPIHKVNLRGADFSFDPRKLDIRRETGGAQHGMCFDDFGNKFVCSNSDHAQAILYDDRYLARNPHFQGVPARRSIAVDGGQAPVFRQSPVEPWRIVRTRLRVAGRVPGPVEGGGTAAGYFTGSTGITIYRGDAQSVEKGTAIIGDVGSNIVHRKKIQWHGLDLTATRIDPGSELITSTDNWFRPVQFGNSPEGCLYVLDMYREVIEHPKSLPPMIKKHLDLTSGRDRGRIYRLGNPKLHRPKELDPDSPASELVAFLDHPNSWHRETAARLIHQRQDESVAGRIRSSIEGFSPVGKIHALWALSGLGALEKRDTTIAAADPHPDVRRHAILLAERTDPDWLAHSAFKALVRDPEPRVRMQLAFSAGAGSDELRMDYLWGLMRSSDLHPLMLTAIMSSANGIQAALLDKLARDSELAGRQWGRVLRSSLIAQIARRNQPDELGRFTQMIVDMCQGNRVQAAMDLARVAVRSNSKFRSLFRQHKVLAPFLERQLKESLAIALDPTASIEQRKAALQSLETGQVADYRDSLVRLVDVRVPPPIQLSALELLGTLNDRETGTRLMEIRRGVGAVAAKKIKELLLGRETWARLLLEQAKPGEITTNELQLLGRSRNPELASLAAEMLKRSNLGGRQQVISRYQPAIRMLGDVEKGRAVFEKNCAKCHRAGGVGFEIGPNLAAMRARGKSAILANVLDPNLEVNPQFVNYIVETADGRTHTGMLANETETSITLKQENNKTTTLLKSDIEAIKNSGLSLMPTGLEKDLPVEQMADLLEFLIQSGQ